MDASLDLRLRILPHRRGRHLSARLWRWCTRRRLASRGHGRSDAMITAELRSAAATLSFLRDARNIGCRGGLRRDDAIRRSHRDRRAATRSAIESPTGARPTNRPIRRRTRIGGICLNRRRTSPRAHNRRGLANARRYSDCTVGRTKARAKTRRDGPATGIRLHVDVPLTSRRRQRRAIAVSEMLRAFTPVIPIEMRSTYQITRPRRLMIPTIVMMRGPRASG